ncbi:hypothetical protein L1987_18816 [Smallanthus sonchifolius]|uniref:Uncharacterized protein n=1 Tax=Smallanthus sonchifolius TaxID=185202 RepID=A0ACB9J1T3_9ASTR|nr:hypothetical protein L1987_18816 [Smallanthus sonchifolius]
MDDGQVLLYANSVNTRYQTIPYPWLVFGEKVKVNTVFIRDSTGVSDSILILFGGGLDNGVSPGHLKMLGGYIDFFMDPTLAESYVNLKQELDQLLQKLKDPKVDIHKEGKYLMLAVQELVSGDQCEGRFENQKRNKQLAERDAAVEVLAWLTHTSGSNRQEDDNNSPPDLTENTLKLLSTRRKSKSCSGRE